MLTKRITIGLIAAMFGFGGCASLEPPRLSGPTIQTLIVTKTPLGSSLSQVQTFLIHHGGDIIPDLPDHPWLMLRRTDGRAVELGGRYFVRGNLVGVVWRFADGRHLSDVRIVRFMQ